MSYDVVQADDLRGLVVAIRAHELDVVLPSLDGGRSWTPGDVVCTWRMDRVRLVERPDPGFVADARPHRWPRAKEHS